MGAIRGLTHSNKNVVFVDLLSLRFSISYIDVEIHLWCVHITVRCGYKCTRKSFAHPQQMWNFESAVVSETILFSLVLKYSSYSLKNVKEIIFSMWQTLPEFNLYFQLHWAIEWCTTDTYAIWLWHCLGVSFTNMILVIPAYNSPQTTHCIMKGELGSVTLGSGES